MRHTLRNQIRKNLLEFLSLADKVYYRTNKLPPLYQQVIHKITGGDSWTKLVADMAYAYAQNNRRTGEWAVSVINGSSEPEEQEYEVNDSTVPRKDWMEIKERYDDLKSYNKNTLPIKGLDPKGMEDTWALINGLKYRRKALEGLQKMPSVAMRNLRQDMRVPRSAQELQEYARLVDYVNMHMSQLSNRDEESRKKVQAKFFRSNITIDQLSNMVDDKENLLGGYSIDRTEVQQMIQRTGGDLEMIYDKGDHAVVKVHGPEGIQELGCNSLWCFTYSRDGRMNMNDWDNYSTNDVVYVFIDFSEPSDSSQFMHTLIKPIDWASQEEEGNDEKLFTMDNNPHYDPVGFVSDTIGLNVAQNLLNFDQENEEAAKAESTDVVNEIRKMIYVQIVNEESDKISGGKADEMTAKDIADKFNVPVSDIQKQITMGVKVEMEHVDNESLAKEIALDHLTEFPDYYTRLNKMEKDAEKDWDN